MDRRRCGDASGEMSVYASLFKEHHITGKQLLLLEEEDLKDMGIVSRGHIIHLKTAIEKLTHDYLNLFHFPPLIKDSAGGAEENIEKVVNLELVFGYHLKPGNGPKDCKWKMYMEMDGDEIAITYIKDVTFNTNLPDVEILKMTKPPFVMEKWIVGIEEHQSVECVVTYESDVRAPKSTRHIQAICWSKVKAQDEVETVQLMIQTSVANSEGNSRSRSDSAWQDVPELGLTLVDIGFLSTQVSPAALVYLSLPSEGQAVRGQSSGMKGMKMKTGEITVAQVTTAIT
ncbi:hypothetical protein BTVI_129594 [Pitangus sulphuratus]|nr:hypothetical protein BTVI_129594 [Pitangus sulphuratus]